MIKKLKLFYQNYLGSRKKIFAASSLLLFMLVLLPATSLALEIRTERSWTLPSDKTVSDDIFASGLDVKIEGTLESDLIFVGGKLDFVGHAKGDLLIIASSAQIQGDVAGSVWLAAGEVTITGRVSGNVVVFGGSVNIQSGAYVAKDLIIVGGNIEYFGNTGGNVKISGGTARIGGSIQYNLEMNTQKITITGSTVVGKDFRYKSPKVAVIENGAKITGKTYYTPKRTSIRQIDILSKFISGLGYLLIVFLLIWLFAKKTESIYEKMDQGIVRTFAVGLVVILATPILALIISVTIIGIPLAVITSIIWLVILYISKTFAGLWLGHKILQNVERKKPNPIWSALIGTALILMASYIPLIGPIIAFISIAIGTGGIFLLLKDELGAKIK